MNELSTLLTRVRDAANDPQPDGAAWCSKERIYPPGYPKAAKLRERWGVPVGGKRPNRQGERRSDEPAVNLDATIARRARQARLAKATDKENQ
jgi:hypothetical protein